LSKNKSGIWSFFSSVKLAIFLLALIALFAIIGTVVPQREGTSELAQHMSPGLFSFLHKIQLFDLYHSIWFFLLMGFLSVNLIICSVDRFPMTWRRFRQKLSSDNEDVFKDNPEENVIRTGQDQKTAAGAVAALLGKKSRRVQRQDNTKTTFFCIDRGRFAHLGVFIVHLSILILIAGAIIGSIFGTEGNVNIIEGETINTIDLRSGNRTLPLPFSVRCDKFTVELYDSGAPKTYRSELTFLKDNKILHQGKLLVNHPITFEGFRFYQSSYGRAPEGRAVLSLFKNEKKIRDISVGLGDAFDLPDGEGKVHVLRVEENLMKMGPAVKLSVHAKSGETVFWVFEQIKKIRQMNPDAIERIDIFNPGLFRPYLFVLTGMNEKYYTGLQVSRDPGAPIVGAAAIWMIIGLIVVLFSYPRQIWIRIDREGKMTKISIAGRSLKNRTGLERELQHLLMKIRANLENSK
jgi:cytochrome c biogenesis protein